MTMKRTGFSHVFTTTQSDLLQHNGKSFKVIRKLTETEVDIHEVGNQYIIKLETGEEIQAFEDEISEYHETPETEEEQIVKNIKVTKDNIDDLIDQWHESDPEDKTPLHEFLGMTQEEYSKWVDTDELTYKNPVILATHNGTFHADDVFAYAVLKAVFPEHSLIRSRREDELAKADIVFDVGGGVYDHHSIDKEYRQLENLTKADDAVAEQGTPYAAFGLIWRDFGNQFLQVHGIEEQLERDELHRRIDKSFVEGIDAFDNGISVLPPPQEGVHSIAVQTASTLMSDFNVYAFDEDSETNAFRMASDMALVLLKNALANHRKSLSEKSIVIDAFHARSEKELLVLPEGCNWKRTLAELDIDQEVKFVVYPDSNEGYRIQVVTVSPASFEARKDLPVDWAGKRDEELGDVIGIHDAVFCHPGRFLAGARSKESILKMAEQALNA